MKKWKTPLLWILAVLLTLALFVLHRRTGPTKPVRGEETIAGAKIDYYLPRSHYKFEPAVVSVTDPSQTFSGLIIYKRFRTDDAWEVVNLRRSGDRLSGELPGQPAAGKLEYRVKLSRNLSEWMLADGRSIVIRFKGRVPGLLLIVHILFMFLGMLFAIRTGLEALRRDGNYAPLVLPTLLITALGGLLLGPLVQKAAFGAYWTGFPFGGDLTDSKTLALCLIWLAAFFLRKMSRWWIAGASLLMILLYLIPHSLFGSELNYQTGDVETGISVFSDNSDHSRIS